MIDQGELVSNFYHPRARGYLDVLIQKLKGMEDLVITKFFGYFPEDFYQEIYAVGYNEYLNGVNALKATLLEHFPQRQEEIEVNCSKMLDKYSHEFDKKWFARFSEYCSKNLFTIEDHVPVYKPEMEPMEENRVAHDKSLNLRHCIMATEYLNVQLLAKMRELDAEIERRKGLLTKVSETEQKLQLVKRAKELEQRLDALDQPPEI